MSQQIVRRKGERLSRVIAVGWLALAAVAFVAAFREGSLAARSNLQPSFSPPPPSSPLQTISVAAKVNWITILRSLIDRFTNDRLMAVAAGVTFYALLAIFPALAAMVSLYALIADPSTIQDHLNMLSSIVPSGAMDIVDEQVKRIASKSGGALGFGFLAGLAISVWSANAGVKALFDALNIVYEVRETRGFFRLNAISLTFTLGLIVFSIVALIGLVGVPLVIAYVGLNGGGGWAISLCRWPALLVIVGVMLAIFYRFGSCRPDARWRWISPGSAVASLLWLAASAAFSWYAANIATYNQTYGTLGAAIGMMTWMWISLNIVLLGGEVNAQFDSQTSLSGALS